MPLYVNVYEVWDAYGGPEEGGWWYTCANPILSRGVASPAFAQAVQSKLCEEYPATTSRRRTDDNYAVLIETKPGEFYPKERPHYE